MKPNIKALRGMSDILPDEIGKWQFAENAARSLFDQYGYEEIRTPILEETALFKRGIGEETDIVQKQMYSFRDRGERDVALRPEGTASIVRAYLEHGMDKVSPLSKLYYIGPMFRNERPQAGRQRQFYQIGAEAMGPQSPYLDAELIFIMMKILEKCGLGDAELKINSLGCGKDKRAFEQALKKALAGELNRFCEDCKKRYDKNVLRIFDCKNETCKQALRQAPKITDHLCADCKAHFDGIKEALGSAGIKYTINPSLVRGLDYYTGAVFEVTHKNLGSQDAVAAGGRYDNLIKELGGASVPACGFAIGFDRLLIAAADKISPAGNRAELFLIGLGPEAQKKVFNILTELRAKDISCQMGFDEKSLKSQMRFADKIKARRVLIVGDDEIKNGKAVLRDMEKKEQKEISLKDVTDTHLW
jgi:histidyl-tRNA synthetase